jgi:transcriptional regulator with XRE-family HTH domain/tetratricopeptide (TPR) repeat protein
MFGDLVRDLRQRMGLTQEQLAQKTGLSARHVRDIESGRTARPRAGTVLLLADAFGLSDTERERFWPAVASAGGEARRAPAAPRPAGAVTPAQLPPDVNGFTGRRDELARLDALVPPRHQSTALTVVAIWGSAGVGKTALAVHWLHLVRDRFPDGQLFVDLRGFDPTTGPKPAAEAVRELLEALEVAPERIPAGLDAQVTLYRSLIADRRMAILLDNAHDANHIRPLLPAAAGSLVVVTSRTKLVGVVAAVGAHPVMLDLLSAGQARALLGARLGSTRLGADEAAVDDIVARSAGLPLALTIIAARAATDPDRPLAAVAAELADADRVLDTLSTGDSDIDVRAAFAVSYQHLAPTAARLFRMRALVAGPDLSAAAAAGLAGVAPRETAAALDELTRAHLFTQHAGDRYRCHDLLRAYAAELNRAIDADADRQHARRRLVDHLLHTAHAADGFLDPHQESVPLPPPLPGVLPESPADRAAAERWFAAEHQVLVAAVEMAARAGLTEHAWQLAWAITTSLNQRGRWHDLAEVHRTALASARAAGDLQGQAYAHRGLGMARSRLGDFTSATADFACALELETRLGNAERQARIHHNLGQLLGRHGRPREAFAHFSQALDRYREVDDSSGWQARTLNAMGFCHALLDEHHAALDRCHEALALLQRTGDRTGEAATWDSLGFIHLHLGDHHRSVACYHRALDLMLALGYRGLMAETYERLGDTHRAAGDLDAARHAWQHAKALLTELNRPTEHIDGKLRAEHERSKLP